MLFMSVRAGTNIARAYHRDWMGGRSGHANHPAAFSGIRSTGLTAWTGKMIFRAVTQAGKNVYPRGVTAGAFLPPFYYGLTHDGLARSRSPFLRQAAVLRCSGPQRKLVCLSSCSPPRASRRGDLG